MGGFREGRIVVQMVLSELSFFLSPSRSELYSQLHWLYPQALLRVLRQLQFPSDLLAQQK